MIIVFSIIITSFLISNYFCKIRLDENLRYKKNDYYMASFILVNIAWVLYFLSFVLDLRVLRIFSLILMIILFVKEVVLSVVKIVFYNKEYKSLLGDINSDLRRIKVSMEVDAIKQIFYLLGAPLILLQLIINYLLKRCFK